MASYNVWSSLGANIAGLSQTIVDNVASTATNVYNKAKDFLDGDVSESDVQLTNIDDIISTYNSSISSLKSSISELNNSSLKYIEEYDKYIYKYLYDASILKRKMIDVVERTVNNELE